VTGVRFEGQDCLIVSHFIRFIFPSLSNTFAAVATPRESWRNKFSFHVHKRFQSIYYWHKRDSAAV